MLLRHVAGVDGALEVGPSNQLGSLGSAVSSPAGPGGARPPNAFWRNLYAKECFRRPL